MQTFNVSPINIIYKYSYTYRPRTLPKNKEYRSCHSHKSNSQEIEEKPQLNKKKSSRKREEYHIVGTLYMYIF